MEILSAAEMGVVDRLTASHFNVPVSELMERAGGAVAAFCLRRYGAARHVVVLCGRGNNGGDGMVAARVLAVAGLQVQVILLGRADQMQGEAAEALRRARAASVAVDEVPDEAALRGFGGAIDQADLLVDAVLGTGFKPPMRGLAVLLQQMVQAAKAPLVAVDLPSGWDADSQEQTAEGAFRADAVVTFTAPRAAHVFGHLASSAGTLFGPVVMAQIGSPAEAVISAGKLRWTGAAKAIAERPRPAKSNKGKFGHVLVVGGSYGTAGAPTMASLAAMRTGAGLVTAGVVGSIVGLVAGIAPELMIAPLAEGPDGAVGTASLAEALKVILEKRICVVAVGPGLSQRGEASEFARELVRDAVDKDGARLPMVVDADALNAFADKPELLKRAAVGRTLVLTPHPGEMARLVGMTVSEVEKDRVGLARRFATQNRLTLVLKGWRTLVAHPDGMVAVNTTGNPSMAKGGSGDILTGIVAAMLAQYSEDVPRAVEAAVYLHGLAADFAARAMDEHTVLATDTVAHLSDAFRYRVADEDGMTWICGLRREEA
jgi:hydroxyethylthiazole kinase-like uncharacterized protein yjeF